MAKWFCAALLAACAVPAVADLLKIVNVNAPAINCVFHPSCRVTVSDTSAPIAISGAAGSGFLQTRTYRGRKGARAAGLYVYEYRVDLRNLAGILKLPAIVSLRVDFGPVVNSLDYDGDGKTGDQVFVITRGGLGSVAPVSAEQTGNMITFEFGAGVSGGASRGRGQSSFFFGVVSSKPPRPSTASAATNSGATLTLSARAPSYSK